MPADGRFGCGPSQGPPRAASTPSPRSATTLPRHLAPPGAGQEPGRPGPRRAWPSCSRLPEGYEVVLGNGGTTAFWDVAAFGLVRDRAQHLTFGEFSRQVRHRRRRAPRSSASPTVIKAEPGHAPDPGRRGRRRRLRLAAQRDLHRRRWPRSARSPAPTTARSCSSTPPPAPAACRSTSPRPTSTTSPRRSASPPTAASGSPLISPAALARVDEIAASGRWVPDFFDLPTAIDNSRKNQTYNTPALATLFLLAEQIDWINGQGGLDWAGRAHRRLLARASTAGPRRRAYATPFVTDPAHRSQVVGTIDFDDDDRRRRGRQGAARQRHRRHRALPQARPQPAARRDVPGGRPRRRRGADRLHRLRGGADPGLTPPAPHARRRGARSRTGAPRRRSSPLTGRRYGARCGRAVPRRPGRLGHDDRHGRRQRDDQRPAARHHGGRTPRGRADRPAGSPPAPA